MEPITPLINENTGPPTSKRDEPEREPSVEDYEAMLGEPDLSDDEAHELLSLLLQITATFARIGYDLELQPEAGNKTRLLLAPIQNHANKVLHLSTNPADEQPTADGHRPEEETDHEQP
ncbi:MAG: hypothetical protein AAF515_16815 [Pseudomonadota bacterium]